MRLTKEVKIGERRILVRELTVADVRAWVKDLAAGAGADATDWALFEDVTLPDLVRLSDLTAEEIENLTPSELRQVIDAAREVNADFFGMRARLVSLSQTALRAGAPA